MPAAPLPPAPTLPAAALALALLLCAGCGSQRPDTRTADGKADGGKVFRIYCAGCHGEDGRRGRGPMLLVDGTRESLEEIRKVVTEGRNEMPGWERRLPPDELEAVVEYVRQLEAPPADPQPK